MLAGADVGCVCNRGAGGVLGMALGVRSAGRAGGIGVDAKGFGRGWSSLCASALAHIIKAVPEAMQSKRGKRLAFKFSSEPVIERINAIPLREPWRLNRRPKAAPDSPAIASIEPTAARPLGPRLSPSYRLKSWHPHGGDGGIRTLDRALQPYNGLANRRLQPLGHVSMPDRTRAYALCRWQICPRLRPMASEAPDREFRQIGRAGSRGAKTCETMALL